MTLLDFLLTSCLLVMLFIIQPVLLAVCVKRTYRLNAIVWGLISLASNIGYFLFFESHLSPHSLVNFAAELGTVMGTSITSILIVLELLVNRPQATTRSGLFQRGLLRIWVLISAGWIILCTLEFAILPCYSYSCGFFARAVFGGGSFAPNYFDIGKGFVGVPTLAFVIGLAVCWVVNAFQRSTPN